MYSSVNYVPNETTFNNVGATSNSDVLPFTSDTLVAQNCVDLGVANNNYKTTFEDIPKEIIISKVFSLLRDKERQIIRAVALSWMTTVDTYFGKQIHINNINWDILRHTSNVRHAKFSNWTRDFQPDINKYLTIKLTVLEIENPNTILTYYNTLPLLQSCPYLETLIIGNLVSAAVRGVTDINLNDWTTSARSWFPKLTTFKFIDNWPTRSACFGDYSQRSIQQKKEFLTFLFQSFEDTKLSRIEIRLENSIWWFPLGIIFKKQSEDSNHFPLEKEKYGSLFQVPLESLSKRLDHLENIIFHYHKTITSIKFHPNLTTDKVRQIQNFSKVSFDYHQPSETPMFDSNCNAAQSGIWLEILELQLKLEEFTLEMKSINENEFNRVKGILAKNQFTLEKVNIFICVDQEINPDVVWNGDLFNGFKNLKVFSLLCLSKRPTVKYYCDDQYDHPQRPQVPEAPVFQNLTMLPSSIKHLKLQCPLDMNPLDVPHCFRRFENLKALELVTGSVWFLTCLGPIYKIGTKELKTLLSALPNMQRLTLRWLTGDENLGLPFPSVDKGTIDMIKDGILDFSHTQDRWDYNVLILNAQKCQKILLQCCFK